MQPCAATWQAFSSQRALDFLRSQQFVAEGCAAASLSLAVMPHLSCHWLRCGLATCTHTTPTPYKHTDTTLSHKVAHPVSNGGPDAVSGLVPRTWTYPAFAAGSDGPKTLEARRCRVLRRTALAGSTDCESVLCFNA